MYLVWATCGAPSTNLLSITMKSAEQSNHRKIGRPLSFDPDQALEQALLLFWKHGYESTSISDLIGVMGITAPSLYAAFGDKRSLFMAALRRYLGTPIAALALIENATTAKQAARKLLTNSAIAFTGEHTPPGCLLATATASCSAASADVQEALAEIRRGFGRQLSDKIRADIAGGRLPTGIDAETLSGHVMAVIQGMSSLARDGASRQSLLAIARSALKAWPVLKISR
jgi:AcrR family transcriptional regulator